MHKRGQATIFIIVGLVVLAIILLTLFLRGQISLGPITQDSIESEFSGIEEHFQDCMEKIGEKYIYQLARQGGYLRQSELTYRNYYDGNEANPISYLCFNLPKSETCQNRMLTENHIEQELSEFILNEMRAECLENFPVKSRYNVQKEIPALVVQVGSDNIVLLLTYQITLSYNEFSAKRNQFTANIQLPLGRLYDTATTIVNSEALIGNFETLVYSVKKTEYTGKPYIVQKLQPYPDKLYKIKIKAIPSENNPLIFQFFIQGEDRFEET